MFESARVKLTGYYLLIIMLISVIFSMAFYRVATMGIEQGLTKLETRIRNTPSFREIPPQILEIAEELEFAKKLVAVRLVYINGFIFVVAGAAGYFLAGKTLEPIEKAHEEQKRFISDASHELRTPIAALQTTIEVELRNKSLTKTMRTTFTELLERINDLNNLTNSLLRLAKHQQHAKSHTEKVSMQRIISNTIKTLSPLANEKHITIKTSATKTPLPVSGDSVGLTELLTIVIDNAIAYSDEKSTITITAEKKSKCAIVRVQDTGVGIDAKDLPHVFDRFYRASRSRTKQNKGGYGLGLSVAKRIVDHHGGTIKLQSTKDTGTSVEIRLPLA